MTIEYIPNHVDRGLARLISQYVDKPLIRAWIASYLKLLQDVEDALWEVITERSLDASIGLQLDWIGKIVNRARGSLSDDDYRIALRAEIRVLRSDGRAVDIIEVSALALPPGYTYDFEDEGIATIRYEIAEPVMFDPLVLFHALLRTKAGGVRLLFEFVRQDVDLYFIWKDDASTDDIGFGDIVSHTGGLLSCALGA